MKYSNLLDYFVTLATRLQLHNNLGYDFSGNKGAIA
jgi:hypothetical protein